MAYTRYVAVIEAKGVGIELWVNDIPVFSAAPGEASSGADCPLNEFLVSGPNEAALIVRPAGAGSVTVRVAPFAETENVVQNHPPPVAVWEWSGAADEPLRIERAFQAESRSAGWAWQRAAVLDLEQARPAATEFLNRLHAMLRGDAQGFLAQMNLKTAEITEDGYGVSPLPLVNSFRNQLDRVNGGEPGWQLGPLNDLALRLVARGRMIDCIRRDGGHALEYRHRDGRTFFLPTMIGLLDGVWAVLR